MCLTCSHSKEEIVENAISWLCYLNFALLIFGLLLSFFCSKNAEEFVGIFLCIQMSLYSFAHRTGNMDIFKNNNILYSQAEKIASLAC